MMALTSGAACCVASAQTILSPTALVDTMREHAVTHLCSPASIVAALPEAELPALRMVHVGGEACPPELVNRWAPGRRFFNVYGPTEASIIAIAAECRPDGTKPLIGRPIANTQAYILDHYLQPVPVGVTGELYLAGVCLARGYLNQPALTADRFIPCPFGSQPGSRMYHTGDLARYLPDGNIDFVGRRDFQVKIRGFRVEPGETEAVLRQHPAVREAIVITRQGKAGDTRLIAYAVLQPQSTATPSELQAYLRQVLPQYMIPSAVVLLESMPLTSSGKVDRRSLPTPSDISAPVSPSFAAPRTATETIIADIWKEVLGLDQVGSHDNFFELGGHSLLAMRVIALIEKRLGLRIGPRDLVFQTLSQLAASCDAKIAQHTKDKGSTGMIGTPSRVLSGTGGVRRGIKRLFGEKS
jgi:non-ribosomal peptide synthetase component E (peptide arylation enzyme)/acyl carrier protein